MAHYDELMPGHKAVIDLIKELGIQSIALTDATDAVITYDDNSLYFVDGIPVNEIFGEDQVHI